MKAPRLFGGIGDIFDWSLSVRQPWYETLFRSGARLDRSRGDLVRFLAI